MTPNPIYETPSKVMTVREILEVLNRLDPDQPLGVVVLKPRKNPQDPECPSSIGKTHYLYMHLGAGGVDAYVNLRVPPVVLDNGAVVDPKTAYLLAIATNVQEIAEATANAVIRRLSPSLE